MNTRVYLAQFPDGHIAECSANLLAEAIYENVNEEGHEELLFVEIIDHIKDPNVQESNQRYTTGGWKINIMWNDGSNYLAFDD